MKKRTICVAMLLSLLVLLLAGCGETDQSRYENAQSLMAKKSFTALAYSKAGDRDKAFALWHEAGKASVAAGRYHTVGLKADGTVAAVGDNGDGQCGVSGWTDIVAVTAGEYHTVGLKADGTVVAAGWNEAGQCDVSGWTDIVAVAAGGYHTVGLKADGTVAAAGRNDEGQCDVSGWTDIKKP